MSRPRAPRGLSAASRRRWKARTDQFAAVDRLTPAVLDALSSWALAVESLSDAQGRWEAAGSPGTAPGSMGQEGQHPLAVAVERARRLEAQLNMALERMIRRVPVEAIPEGGELVHVGGARQHLLLDGRLHVLGQDGAWHLSLHEDGSAVGLYVREVDADGVPRFHMPPPLRKVPAGGYPEMPTDDELEWYGERCGIELAALLEWRRVWLESHQSRPARATGLLRNSRIDSLVDWDDPLERLSPPSVNGG